jgi:hypothetical protein
MGTEKDPSGVDQHTRGQCRQAVSNENLVVEVQNRGSFMHWVLIFGVPRN